ncbi:helix-turn-helix domain-containing protein [Brachybacterium sacelli]|uniref:Transcriptional regulator with XRE-family HTH domain n=1 Tax=Brachybacterium sacelli TaxID=173364 RepID=A0ABS4X5S1_9MICO|nr:helix-turn-helix domain-containing protein [Brachybacterium sacelli]MBP2383785.1 transcriptional regulator with XRE-family HTH domain [Brachybacterium sacelli]
MSNESQPDAPHPDDLPNLAERLDLLFRTVPRSSHDSELHSSASVAKELQQQNIQVTPNHIRALRTGRRGNPSFRLLAGLAEIFQVPLDYFVDESVSAEIQESLQALVAMRDTGVQQIMMRAHGVSTESLGPVLSLLDQIRRMEGLDTSGEQEDTNA